MGATTQTFSRLCGNIWMEKLRLKKSLSAWLCFGDFFGERGIDPFSRQCRTVRPVLKARAG